MDDLFNFSFPGFDGLSDAASGFDSLFSSFGQSFGEELPSIAEQVAKFAINRAFSNQSPQHSTQQLLNGFLHNAMAGVSANSQSGSYFQASHGQSMGQLAAMISRAGQRFL